MTALGFGSALVRLLGMVIDLITEAHEKGYIDEMSAAEAAYQATKLARFHKPGDTT